MFDDQGNIDLTVQIEDFLSQHSPSFGYAEGLDGQENQEQWIQIIANDLTCQKEGTAWTIAF